MPVNFPTFHLKVIHHMAVDQKLWNRPLVAWKMSTVVLNLKNLCFFFSLDHCGAYRLKPGIKKCKSSSYLKCFVIFVQRYTGSSAAVSVTDKLFTSVTKRLLRLRGEIWHKSSCWVTVLINTSTPKPSVSKVQVKLRGRQLWSGDWDLLSSPSHQPLGSTPKRFQKHYFCTIV